jgi:hypothetical protein
VKAPKFRPAVGDRVLISTPDNPRADGQPATVAAIADWGAHLSTAFGSGSFRAAWGEMLPPDRPPAVRTSAPVAATRAAGFSGEICSKCQGQRLVRSGTCNTCMDCGETTGCS